MIAETAGPVPRASRFDAVLTLPNAITSLRILALGPLWVLALSGRGGWLALGLFIAAMTDVVDGRLARRQGITKLGSQLDSIADLLLALSTLAWLVLLRPDLLFDHAEWLAGWAAVGLAAIAVGWIRFRRVGDLHLWSAKVADVTAYAFALAVFLDLPSAGSFFVPVLLVCMVAALEHLVAVSALHRVDEHVGTILRAVPRA